MARTDPALPDLLRRRPLFTGLSPEQIDALAAGSRITPICGGEVLFRQGDPVRAFFCVLRGQMQLSVANADGAEKVVEIVTAGESFGVAVVFEGLRYPVTATALVATELLAVSGAAVSDLLDRDPTFARRMLANMAIRLRRLILDVESYSLRTGVQRVIGFLLHEARVNAEAGGPARGEAARRCTVLLPTKKHVLASRLNLAPETFSRVLRDLSAAGLISVQGRRITLLDVPRLEAQLQ